MLKTMVYVLGPVMLIGTSFLSAAVNLMGVAFGVATLATTVCLNNNAVRRILSIPELEPPVASVDPAANPTSPAPGTEHLTPMYEAPRKTQTLTEKMSSSFDDAKKAVSDKMASAGGAMSSTAEEKAEKRRKEQIRKMEEKRLQQERDHFEAKYKKK